MGSWAWLVAALSLGAGGCATEVCVDAPVRPLDVAMRLHGAPGAREVALEGATLCGPCGCSTSDARGRATIDAAEGVDTLLEVSRAGFVGGVVTVDEDRSGAVSLPLVSEVDLARVAASAGIIVDPERGQVVFDAVGDVPQTTVRLVDSGRRAVAGTRVYTDDGGLADPGRVYLAHTGRVWFFDVAPGTHFIETDLPPACELELGGDAGAHTSVEVVAGAVAFVRRACRLAP